MRINPSGTKRLRLAAGAALVGPALALGPLAAPAFADATHAAKTGSVTGRVWNDANHNGRQDTGEKGVKGAIVVLLSFHGDSDSEAGRATTGADGRYAFTKLTPSEPGVSGYIVAAATPAKSWTFTKSNVGGDGRDSDLKISPPDEGPWGYHRYFPKGAIVGDSGPLQVRAGKATDVDAGLVQTGPAPSAPSAPKTAQIVGRFWNDANHNGRRDASEKGVGGTRVVLLWAGRNGSRVVAKTTTAADGRYAFRRLAPTPYGSEAGYLLVAGAPSSAWHFTKRSVGAESRDSDLQPYQGEYARYFRKGTVLGFATGGADVFAGRTRTIDAGLIRSGGADQPGGGSSLPVTGPGAQAIAASGGVLVSGGVVALLLARRRRPVVIGG